MSSRADVLLAVGCHTPCIRRYSLESIDMSGRKLLLDSADQDILTCCMASLLLLFHAVSLITFMTGS